MHGLPNFPQHITHFFNYPPYPNKLLRVELSKSSHLAKACNRSYWETMRHIEHQCNTMPRVSRRNPAHDGSNDEPKKDCQKKSFTIVKPTATKGTASTTMHHVTTNQQMPRVTKSQECQIREGSRLCPPPQKGKALKLQASPRILNQPNRQHTHLLPSASTHFWLSKIGPLLNS